MLPLVGLGVGAIVIGSAVLALLNDAVKQHHEQWQQHSSDLQRQSRQQRQQLSRAMQFARTSSDYHRYIAMHHASVQTANQAFALYDSAKIVLVGLNQQKVISAEKIGWLKQQRNQTTGPQREQLSQLLQQQHETHHQIKASIHAYLEQKNTYYHELQQLNSATTALKQYIKQHTGIAGQNWYARLQQRQR